MPELPEVEHYRQILLSLVSNESKGQKQSVHLDFGPPPLPTKRFPAERTLRLINEGDYEITDVLRKGKVLCVVLKKTTETDTAAAKEGDIFTITEEADISGKEATILVSLHMGMTGRISSPNHIPKLESLSEECSYPPPHTHLIINSPNGQQACFSDPRRFGSVFVHSYDCQNDIGEEHIPAFQELAPDALTSAKDSDLDIVTKFANQKKVIKAILLDQRQVMSGIGNWVADEVLYRSRLHPDQSFLTISEASTLVSEIHYVLSTAVTCLNGEEEQLPEQWLFHRRWRGGGSNGANSKDFNGKKISFVKSGGRSSAIVPSLQKKVARKVIAADSETASCEKKKSATKPRASVKRRKT
mmetsp:Transcript_7939/g.13156  ORF Transcript_7939/g.13156 Transcript_7939/m.13156 type:complete len:357 (+) Transcript_7939:100-1170(+)